MPLTSGCCLAECNVNDLSFVSLTKPGAADIASGSQPASGPRLHLTPEDLKLSFSTRRNLFRLEDRTDTAGAYLRVSLCQDRTKTVSFSQIYTEDGWSANRLDYTNPLVVEPGKKGMEDPNIPPQPVMRPRPDGRYLYEAPVRFTSVSTWSSYQHGFGSTSQPMPSDVRSFPDLCFTIDTSGYTSFGSNEAVLPRAVILEVLVPNELPAAH